MGSSRERVAETQAFFGPRAAAWNTRFAEDGPALAVAIAELGLVVGDTVVDAGCGAGRALPPLEAAVGPTGRVVGFDVTPEMLAVAKGEASAASVLLADGMELPLADRSCDAVFASGYLCHLADERRGLVELARAVRPGGRLAVFQPIGRRALAAKHGREVRDDDPLDERNLTPLLDAAGWDLTAIDDGDDRYLALARRR